MALFIVSIFAIIIPRLERIMLENKKEMISQLTNAAWSIMDEYQLKYEKDSIPLEEAQVQAAAAIELMRYGTERKDYFWIIDMRPFMVMHPYRPELNGTDLSKYQDPEGSFLFMEAVETVKENNEGFINYIWQWKDDSTR
ncbi:MAG: two component system sensor protein, partial [Marinilabiliales bacterium]